MSVRMRLQPEAIGSGMTSQRVRDRLVERLRAGTHEGGGIRDERVLNAIRTVPRHLFVDEALATRAYEDTALPIGHGQTISQPWVVAKMTETLLQTGPVRVLEIGTGSGYQAAVLAGLVERVYTIEIVRPLAERTAGLLKELGFDNIETRIGDGYRGWPENGPFDAILVTAAAPALVEALTAQLAPGGSLVAPVGPASSQSLLRLQRGADGRIAQQDLGPVVFVPLLSGMID